MADATAIQRGLELRENPVVPEEPESLPAPCQNRRNNPKTALAACAKQDKRELSVAEKEHIAATMNDMNLVRARCPLGFAPFAAEVDCHIRPLFGPRLGATPSPGGG